MRLAWLALALGLTACADKRDGGGGRAAAGGKPAITVGSANFPENVVLAEVYAGALEARGFDVTRKLNLGSREALLPAMQRGDIDVLPEYTGALLAFVSEGRARAKDTGEQVTALNSRMPAELTLLEPSTAEDKDVVSCRRDVARRFSLASLEDLARVDHRITLGGPPEFAEREGFGLAGLERVYGIEFERFRPLDVAGPLTVAALEDGRVDCANLFSTQSAISENGFVSLADPKGLVEGENVIPLVAEEAATPEAAGALDAVSAALDTEKLKQLVERVEVDEDEAAAVARDFLGANELD
jgi:osmoprotectant transport system substrate-binding protein